MARKKDKEAEKKESSGEFEQSIWSVRINSQILYKKPVDGRTVLLGMTSEETQKVEKVLDEAIEELSEILEKRTTMHKAPKEKEQITRVDATAPEVPPEEKEKDEIKVDEDKKTSKKKSGVKKEEDDEKNSLLGKLSS